MTPDSFVRKLLTWQPEDICRRVSNSAGRNGSSTKKCRGRSTRVPNLLSKASRLPSTAVIHGINLFCFALRLSVFVLFNWVFFETGSCYWAQAGLQLAISLSLPPKGKSCGHTAYPTFPMASWLCSLHVPLCSIILCHLLILKPSSRSTRWLSG